MPSTAEVSWQDRVRGCLLGGALGDALGAPFEGQPVVSPHALNRVVFSSADLTWTDDTALQLAVASYLAKLECLGDFDDDEHARALAAAWQQDPRRGYGANPPYVFRIVVNDGDWRAAARESFGGDGSLGNGGAMRAAPVGLVADDAAMAADVARSVAAVTHAHPIGQDGAALIAVAAHFAARTRTGEPPAPVEFVESCVRHLATPTVRESVAAVPATLDTTEPATVARVTGNGIVAHEAVAAALSAFLHHPQDPVAAIGFAVRMGGDTDTVAAMAGSLSGAAAGAGALPAQLLDRLEEREGVERIAAELAGRG